VSTPALIIGAGGFLGRQVVAAHPNPVVPPPIDWLSRRADPELFSEALAVVDGSGQIDVMWCAGQGFVGAGAEAMDLETRRFDGFLRALTRSAVRPRTLVLSSTAGAMYAEAVGVADERTPPSPVSHYGRAKLDQERLARAWTGENGRRLVIARMANLYGPGQRLDKPQGLISTIVRATMLRQPVVLYMPLDTIRDYVYVADAGRMLVALLSTEPGTEAEDVKILASHRPVTIGEIVSEAGRIMRRRALVSFGASDWSQQQAAQTVFASMTMPEIDVLARTPLVVGIAAVAHELRTRLRQGQLA
jgi:UDP-glucose 4-epimerase